MAEKKMTDWHRKVLCNFDNAWSATQDMREQIIEEDCYERSRLGGTSPAISYLESGWLQVFLKRFRNAALLCHCVSLFTMLYTGAFGVMEPSSDVWLTSCFSRHLSFCLFLSQKMAAVVSGG
jgi:hypothetical protein